MRKGLLSIVMTLVTITLLSSCLGDGTEYTYYDDAAITSFKLGTLNRYIHTTGKSGKDSTYKRTLNCSNYTFNIDQKNGKIWNVDSLLPDVDAKHVICTVNAKNGAVTYIKSMTSDSLNAYKSTDSIDFSQPREFYIYNSNGSGYRKYTISVNVHKENADSTTWSKIAQISDIAKMKAMKGIVKGETMFLFGNDGTASKLYTTDINDGKNWTEIMTSPALSVDAYKTTVLCKDVFFTLNESKVLKSEDGINWLEVAQVDLKQIVAASTARIYALSNDGKLMSSTDGIAWTVETLDDKAELLPTQDISYTCMPLETNANADKLVLIGNRSADYSDNTAVIWTKVDEYSAGARQNAWNYIAFTDDNHNNRAPRAENWQTVVYDKNIKALTKGTDASFSDIYQCGDAGVTWLNDSILDVPSDLMKTDVPTFTFVSDNKSLWIICAGTGDVWKGRINRVAWKKEQDYFVAQ